MSSKPKVNIDSILKELSHVSRINLIVTSGVCMNLFGSSLHVYISPFLGFCATSNGLYSALITTGIFIGDVIGSFIFGQFADYTGRKPVFIAGIIILHVGAFLSICFTNPIYLFLCRILTGFGVGVRSVPYTILAETIVYPDRYLLFTELGWTLGGVLVIVLASRSLVVHKSKDNIEDDNENLEGWRWLLLELNCVSMLFCSCALIMIPESFRFLVINGRTDEAQVLLYKLSEGRIETIPTIAKVNSTTKIIDGDEYFYDRTDSTDVKSAASTYAYGTYNDNDNDNVPHTDVDGSYNNSNMIPADGFVIKCQANRDLIEKSSLSNSNKVTCRYRSQPYVSPTTLQEVKRLCPIFLLWFAGVGVSYYSIINLSARVTRQEQTCSFDYMEGMFSASSETIGLFYCYFRLQQNYNGLHSTCSFEDVESQNGRIHSGVHRKLFKQEHSSRNYPNFSDMSSTTEMNNIHTSRKRGAFHRNTKSTSETSLIANSFILAALFTVFIRKDQNTYLRTILLFFSRVSALIGNAMTWVITPRIFKTSERARGHSSCHSTARVGAAFSPFVIQGFNLSDFEVTAIIATAMLISAFAASQVHVATKLDETPLSSTTPSYHRLGRTSPIRISRSRRSPQSAADADADVDIDTGRDVALNVDSDISDGYDSDEKPSSDMSISDYLNDDSNSNSNTNNNNEEIIYNDGRNRSNSITRTNEVCKYVAPPPPYELRTGSICTYQDPDLITSNRECELSSHDRHDRGVASSRSGRSGSPDDGEKICTACGLLHAPYEHQLALADDDY